MAKIASGYRISITSWENDADNYKTIVRDGLTREQVAFIAEFCNHLGSKNNGGKARKQFGNMYDPSDSELEELSRFQLELAKKHGIVCDPLQEYDDNYELYGASDQAFYDACGTELYDLGLAGGDWATRVCEKYVVEFVPEPIDIKDVTSEFE